MRPKRQGGDAPVGVPVGLGGADLDLHTLGSEGQVGDVEAGQLAAPGTEGESEHQQRGVTDPDQAMTV
jgi:hypothetical protein